MDAIEMLTKDHDKVRELFKRFNGGGGLTGIIRRTTGTIEPRERRTALAQICKELDMHTRIEERIFYPAVTKLDDGRLVELVQEALSEHAKVKQQVSHLRTRRGDEDGVVEEVQELEQCVEHHATEEEKEMFPRVRNLMPEAERKELGLRMRSLKHAAPEAARRTAKAPSAARGRARSTAGSKKVAARKRGSQKANSTKRAKARGRPKSRVARRR
jgi:hemerythrin superfamily protein